MTRTETARSRAARFRIARGTSSTTACALWEGSRARRDDAALPAGPPDRDSRVSKGNRYPTSPSRPRDHDGRPRQRPLGPPAGILPPCPRRARQGPHRGARCDRHRTRARRGLVARRGSGDPRGRAHPDRVVGLCVLGNGAGRPTCCPARGGLRHANEPRDSYEGVQKFNRHYSDTDYPGFAEFFFSLCVAEPHSTKQLDDLIGWAMDTTPEAAGRHRAGDRGTAIAARGLDEGVVPMLVIAEADDAFTPAAIGVAVADNRRRAARDRGCRARPAGCTPVRFDLALHDSPASTARRETWHRALHRPRRALFVSSRSASGTHGATSRSRGSCARSSGPGDRGSALRSR